MKFIVNALIILVFSTTALARTNPVEDINEIKPTEPGYEELAVHSNTLSLESMSSSLSEHRANVEVQKKGDGPFRQVEGPVNNNRPINNNNPTEI